MISPRVAGILLGYAADLAFADPRRGHPVAGFGSTAAALERVTYRDGRVAGVAHVALLLIPLTVGAELVRRSTVALAAATWVSLGGTSLARTGLAIADDLDRDDVAAARELLPSLCGRDPAHLDHAGLTRAALESIAENTSDAQVSPLVWAAVGGVPGVLVYRAVNTLDAMIGHRSPRYAQFGWAAARLDDIANYLGARVAGVLVVACAPLAGGSAAGAWRLRRRLLSSVDLCHASLENPLPKPTFGGSRRRQPTFGGSQRRRPYRSASLSSTVTGASGAASFSRRRAISSE